VRSLESHLQNSRLSKRFSKYHCQKKRLKRFRGYHCQKNKVNICLVLALRKAILPYALPFVFDETDIFVEPLTRKSAMNLLVVVRLFVTAVTHTHTQPLSRRRSLCFILRFRTYLSLSLSISLSRVQTHACTLSLSLRVFLSF